MKLLFKNRRYLVLISLTIFIVFCTHISSYADITPVTERTPQVRDAIVTAVPGVNNAADVTAAHLAAITSLNLRNTGITALKADDFSGMTALTSLNLFNNQLSSLPDGIFEGMTSLTTIRLGWNTVDPFPMTVTLEKVVEGQFKAVVPAGATFNYVLPIRVANGSINGDITTVTIPQGSVESEVLTVTRTGDTTAHVTVDFGAFPRLAYDHYGYALVKPNSLPLAAIRGINTVPVFSAGTTTTRSIAENTARGVNIGPPMSATDADRDRLTYSLSGTDASSFSIVSTTGQLQTRAALDYETKTSYSVTVSASDGYGGSDSIPVTITVTNVNEAPRFATSTATRSIAENTAANTNIGSAVSATDVDANTTLTYSLSGTDASSFSIVSTTGQLQTRAALDYETQASYSVTVAASDGYGGSDSIPVTITVTNVNEAPRFATSTATRSIAENTAANTNIGSAFAATDEDNDTLTYSLSGTDASSFSIVSTTGQLQTRAALDYETKTSYSVTVSASDGNGGSDSITVTINVTDVHENRAPAFTEGNTATRTVAENTTAGTNIGNAIAATDPNKDTITYRLGGQDASAFSIDTNTGQLKTGTALDYETKVIYSVSVTASDGKLTTTIAVTVNVTDVEELPTVPEVEEEVPTNNAPVFTDGSSATRNVAENTATGVDIGSAVSATDADGDILVYTLGGTDASAFSINSTTGQLRTNASLDYETRSSWTVTITVSDGTLTDSITVTINVTDVDETVDQIVDETLPNRAPVFTDGTSTTRSVAENIGSGVDIGSAVSATDADGDTLTYTLGGTDANAFSINSTNGQLRTSTALDYETKSSYAVTITVSDGKGESGTISVTINVTDVNETPANNAPEFTEGTSTTRAVAENTVVNETPANNAPVFTEGGRTTRAVAENTASGQNIGSAISATDEDNDTLTYSLGGTDASSFSVVSTSGQLQSSAALDYETKTSYAVTVSVSDGNGGSDSISVTINVTDVNETPTNNAPELTEGTSTTRTTRAVAENTVVNETPANNAPVFTDGGRATRTVAENTAAGTNIGSAVSATDADNDPLTYSLGWLEGSPAFSIDSTTGQLRTKAPLDYETKNEYSFAVHANDGKGGRVAISVTINVTDVNETPANNAPVFGEGASATRSIAENTASGTNIGSAVSATDADSDTLTYSLSGTDASSFSIVSTSGQLRTSAALDYETKTSYSVTVSVSDGNGGSDSISVTINVTDVNETPANNAPVFGEGASATRSIAENTASGTNIGSAVSATDADSDTLTYSLSGTDASSFSIVSTSGQLRTSAALDYETKTSYSVTVSVSDGNGGSDSITVTINVTDVNETPANNAPVFGEGASATRSIAENTASGTNIGSAVSATDADSDTLTYSLSGTDASSFSIVSTSGQLQTSAALDYETKTSYSVTVSVSDSNGGSDSITVTINVTEVSESVISTTNITTCSIVHKSGDVYDVTIAGTLTVNRRVESLTVYGYVNNDYIGRHKITWGWLEAGDTPKFSITGTWTHDESTSQDCNLIFSYKPLQFQGAPSAQPLPDKTALLTNFPNPSNPETWIPYQLAKPAKVTLTIYDIRGVVVRRLELGHQPAGMYINRSRAIHWDGRNEFGEKVATGVYFYTLNAGDFTATRKLLIRK